MVLETLALAVWTGFTYVCYEEIMSDVVIVLVLQV